MKRRLNSHLRLIASILTGLILFACARQEPQENATSAMERFGAKWNSYAIPAYDGDARAIEVLDAAFETEKNEDEKFFLASQLERTPSPNPKYRDYMNSLAQRAIQDNPPYPFVVLPWNDEPISVLAPAFRRWCKSRHLTSADGVEYALVRYPLRVGVLDEDSVAWLVRALTSRSHPIALAAAERLSELDRIENAPQIRSAALSMPYFHRVGMAKALAYFDTPSTWAAVDDLVREPEIRSFLRAEVAQSQEEKRVYERP